MNFYIYQATSADGSINLNFATPEACDEDYILGALRKQLDGSTDPAAQDALKRFATQAGRPSIVCVSDPNGTEWVPGDEFFGAGLKAFVDKWGVALLGSYWLKSLRAEDPARVRRVLTSNPPEGYRLHKVGLAHPVVAPASASREDAKGSAIQLLRSILEQGLSSQVGQPSGTAWQNAKPVAVNAALDRAQRDLRRLGVNFSH